MGQKLTQPEEIDLLLKNLADGESGVLAPAAKDGRLPEMHGHAEAASLRGASTSAYRAAYLKTLGRNTIQS